VNASAELLRQAGYQVEVIPSGCCGMAGAFGYETEHYDVSMKVGELALFPTIREKISADENIAVAALGTSCRSQISDGTNIEAQHTVLLIQKVLFA
jgi:Fe-S oxidoreductase